ncbi:MAG TPA: S8 family serine peptidase, partial [Thermoanaerobaculia bacterium]
MKTAALVLSLLVAISASAASIAPDVDRAVARDGRAQVIVSLRAPAAAGKAAFDEITRTRDAVLGTFEGDDFRVIATWGTIPGFAGEVTGSGLAKLAANPAVSKVDLDVDGTGGLEQSIPIVGANTVHAMGFRGAGVTMAILDTGIDSDHPDLEGRIVDEACFCRNSDGSGCCPNGQTSQFGRGAAEDDHGHGTHVAGIAGSRGARAKRSRFGDRQVVAEGMAPEVKFVVVKVLDRNNAFAGSAQVISGLDWVLQNHKEVRALNMSLLTNAHFTGDCDTAAAFAENFASVINGLRTNGTAVFACSGNTGSLTSIGAPACVHNTISVGATLDAANITNSCGVSGVDEVACFSDSDTTLDLLAPGTRINSARRGGGTTIFSGTSMA